MFNWRKRNSVGRFHLIMDIGSGSVGVALLDTQSTKAAGRSPCLWSKRVHLVIKRSAKGQDGQQQMAALKEAVVNALLLTNSEGLKVLQNITADPDIKDVHVTISAPWVHTVPRRITYKQDEAFLLDENLIDQLLEKAVTDVRSELIDQKVFTEQDIEILQSTIHTFELNGYTLSGARKIKPMNLGSFAFTHYSSFMNRELGAMLKKLIAETFPSPRITIEPFLPLFADLTLRTADDNSFCLFDITHEGTEVGIIRDQTMVAITQLPIGIATLAREIAAVLKAPESTGLHYLNDPSSQSLKQTAGQKAKIDKIIGEYEDLLSKKLLALPDNILPPAAFYIHCDPEFETFFTQKIARIIERLLVDDIKPVHHSSTELINQMAPHTCDSALNLLCHQIMEHYTDKEETESTTE